MICVLYGSCEIRCISNCVCVYYTIMKKGAEVNSGGCEGGINYLGYKFYAVNHEFPCIRIAFGYWRFLCKC